MSTMFGLDAESGKAIKNFIAEQGANTSLQARRP